MPLSHPLTTITTTLIDAGVSKAPNSRTLVSLHTVSLPYASSFRQTNRPTPSLSRCQPTAFSSESAKADHKQTISLMVKTAQLERNMEGATLYWDCFKGTNLRCTEIACMAFLCQVSHGGYSAYSRPPIFEHAGISPSTAYGIDLGGTDIAFCITIISWFLMSKFERQQLHLTSFSFLTSALYLFDGQSRLCSL